MPRPVKPYKHRIDYRTKIVHVGFAELPGRYFASPEYDVKKALQWAKRNKARLLSSADDKLHIAKLAQGFYSPEGEWYQEQIKKGRHLTLASLAIRDGQVRNYIIPLFGDYPVDALSGTLIDKTLLDAQRVSSTSTKPLTRSTLSKILYTIKLMYDRWVSEGIVASNPVNSIVKYSKEPENPRGVLPDNVLNILFPKTHGELIRIWGSTMWACAGLVLLDTGARPNEMRAAKWGEYYPEEHFWPIRTAIEAGTVNKVKATKTSATKPGFLSKQTVEELAIWRSESRFNKDSDWIFTADGENPVCHAAVGQAFKRALKYLGLESKGWTPYWIRL